jgi:FAD/FMN-containing dehydrogenase
MHTETIDRLRDIVGEAAVVGTSGPARVPARMGAAIAFEPRVAVRPTETRQVHEIVAWANRTGTPLVPVSSGRPHLHGGSAPSVPGSVQVDLSGMARIPRIDRRQRLALIEPGVTFGQLVPALRRAGLRIAMPLLPRPNKSVLASLLEREPTLVPRWHWNMTEPLRSVEIIWGNGDRLVSGSQTTTDKDEDWETGIIPMLGGGPAQVDFFRMLSAAQGSMGIATWASVKVEPASDRQKLLFIPAAGLGDLIDCTYKLLKLRFGDETFLANAVTLAQILAREPAERARLAAELPRWCLVVGIGGGSILGAEKVAAREADIADIVRDHGLRVAHELPGCTGARMLDLLQNPSQEPFWREGPAAASRDIFFMSTLDRTPGFVATMQAVDAEMAGPSAGLGVYIQPVHMGADTHCEFILPYDPADSGQTRRAEALFEEGSRALFRAGAYFSRPYGMWAGMVYNADAESTAATRKVKDIFDPNHVMNPGKLCF